jgi:Sulfotransferase family
MPMPAQRTAAAQAPKQRIPDFFIVGHHKSGTTALYEMLRRHPQIYMPDLKEPRFFAEDLRFQFGHQTSARLPQTLAEYLALFEGASPDQRAGEASPSYLKSHTAAAAIAEVQPAARIIAILREPASFIRSLQFQLLQEHVETEKDLAAAIAHEEIEREGRKVRRYSDHVKYVEQLRRYHERFPPEQVLVLIYDDFRGDNDATVRRVLRFLDVDDTAPIEVMDANPTVDVRSLRADRIVRRLYGGGDPVSRLLGGAVRTLTPQGVRRRLARGIRRRVVYGKPQPADERALAQLRRRFKPEVVALSEYLDRDLVSLWGYDGVD